MAKPINPYQGPAPAAMAQMGAGMAEVGANIGRSLQGGYESIGKGISSGITAAADAYTQSKQDQAKFDATKKLFKTFESYLPTQTDPVTKKVTSPIADEVKAIFADTTISTREKIEMAPMVMSLLGNAQQQYGRERVAGIMADSRLDVAGAKNQPRPLPQFDATQTSDPYKQVAGQTSAEPALPSGSSAANPQALQQQDGGSSAPYMIQRPTAQPQPMQQQPRGGMPLTKYNEQTGQMEFWNPGARRYIPEPEELYFNPKTLGLESPRRR